MSGYGQDGHVERVASFTMPAWEQRQQIAPEDAFANLIANEVIDPDSDAAKFLARYHRQRHNCAFCGRSDDDILAVIFAVQSHFTLPLCKMCAMHIGAPLLMVLYPQERMYLIEHVVDATIAQTGVFGESEVAPVA